MSAPRQRPPVVFIHGAFCMGQAFEAFREPFEAAGFATSAPTLPHHGHGADLHALARLGVRDYARAIEAELRPLRDAPILVGHSLGGLVAQLVATRRPVAALALLAPSAPWGVWPTTLDEHGAALGLSLLGDYWNRPIAPDYRVARAATLNRMSSHDARATFAQWTHESGRALGDAVHWWLDHGMASSAPAYRIGAPLLAMAGGRDTINAASTVRRIAGRFPAGQAAFHEFEEMSHWLVGEPGWENVAQLTLAWLGALMEPAPPRRGRRGSAAETVQA